MASIEKLLDKLMNGHDLLALRDWICTYFILKEAGKGLSTNDLTDDLLTRMEAVMTTSEDIGLYVDSSGYLCQRINET